MARSHLHWWRWANLVVRPAWVTAQPKALDCRSLSLHDYRSRALDSSPQRCVSLVAELVARSWIRPNISPSRLGPLSILVVQFEVTHFVSQIHLACASIYR